MGKFKILPRTNDIIFKKLFGDINHANITKGFLQSVLDIPGDEYEIIKIEDPNSKTEKAEIDENSKNITNKESRLDIKIKTNKR